MRQRHLAPLAATLFLAIGEACAANKPATTAPAPASIPTPLVTALINDPYVSSRPEPDYAIGKLPPGYPAQLVPTGSFTVVGGMTRRDETIAIFADSTRRLGAVFQQLFEQAGYARPTPSPGSGFSTPVGPGNYFCGDSGTVSVEPLTGSDRTFARVTFRRTRAGNSCHAMERVIQPHELKLPPLTPPPGAHVGRSGGNGGTSAVGSNAEVTGADLVPSAVVAHYAAQLVAAGWTGATPAISEMVAAEYFEAKDASGGTWDGVLIASGTRTKMDLSLTMNPRGGR